MLDYTAERAQLRRYTANAIGCSEDAFFQDKLQTYPHTLAKSIYAYFVSILELDTARAAEELDLPITRFAPFKAHVTKILENNYPQKFIYIRILQRVSEQLSNPDKAFLYGPIIPIKMSKKLYRSRGENLDIAHIACKYKTKHGYVNRLGEIICRP